MIIYVLAVDVVVVGTSVLVDGDGGSEEVGVLLGESSRHLITVCYNLQVYKFSVSITHKKLSHHVQTLDNSKSPIGLTGALLGTVVSLRLVALSPHQSANALTAQMLI